MEQMHHVNSHSECRIKSVAVPSFFMLSCVSLRAIYGTMRWQKRRIKPALPW